jgi:hypothetical protein
MGRRGFEPMRALLCLTALAWIGLVGCGADSSTGAGEASRNFGEATASIPHSIGSCLVDGGARKATTQKSLTFLRVAEDGQGVSKFGLAYDKVGQLIVRVWEATQYERRPPRWIVWFGQPLDSDYSPWEIIEKHVPDSYVLFLRRPPRAVRAATARCIDFGFGSGQGANLHSISGSG